MLDFVDHVVYYKNLVELHGLVPVRSATPTDSDDEENITKIEYKIITEIEWAERFARYMKKEVGNKISLLQFNNLVGESKRKMKDVRLFSQAGK